MSAPMAPPEMIIRPGHRKREDLQSWPSQRESVTWGQTVAAAKMRLENRKALQPGENTPNQGASAKE